MLLLDSSTKLQIILGGAIATNQLDFTGVYIDAPAFSTPTLASAVSNSTTAVDVIAAPAASNYREIKHLSVFNNDTASVLLTIRTNNAGTTRVIFRVTLAAGDACYYSDTDGWRVLDSVGLLKSGAGGGGGDALTSDPLSQFAGTTSAQLAGVISDETGTGGLVFANSPALVTPTGIVKGDVGLGNVDNTSDANKPVSTATQTALDLKAPLASPTFTGTVTAAALTTTGALINSLNGAVSDPPVTLTGTWYSGGTTTTTKPQLLIEPTGTNSVGWSTAGTGLGVNAASGFTGNLIDLHANGATKFKVAYTGVVTTASGITMSGGDLGLAAGSAVNFSGRVSSDAAASSQYRIRNSAGTGLQAFTLGTSVPSTIGTAPANGQAVSIIQAAESLTIAAAATTTTTMQIPVGAIVLAVSVRVTTVIPTAATFSVKIGAQTFNTAAVSTASTSTDPGTAAGAWYNATAQGIVITPDLTPGAATGVVRVTIVYLISTPPTS